MTEHLCVVCQRRPYDRTQVCTGCRQWLARTLAEIVDLYALLPEQMIPGQTQGQRVSGSREAPLPLRVDPLDLTMPARTATVHEPPCTCKEPRSDCRPGHPHLDQSGQISVGSRLDAWVQDWRDHRDRGERLPEPTVVELGRWLSVRLEDAMDSHPAVDEFAAEMRELRRVLRSVVGVNEVRPEHLDVPCRRCDLLDLHRLPGQDRVECGSCGCLLTEAEYDTWVRLLAAHMREESIA